MLEGAIEPKAIAKQARKLGFPAIGLNDRNGLYAAMPFSEACMAEGVQPIIGALLASPGPATSARRARSTGWCCWPRTRPATTISAAWCRRRTSTGRSTKSRTSRSTRSHGSTEGLIALTAGGEGAFARLFADGQPDKAGTYAERSAGAVPGAALCRTVAARRSDRGGCRSAADRTWLTRSTCPWSRPTRPAYAEPQFHAAHDAMLCIAHSTYVENGERRTSSPEAWLKSGPTMAELFADLPEAIANTAVIAQRCAVAAPQAPADPAAP